MICKQCGKEIPDGSKFCLECGAPVEAEKPAEEVPCEVAEETPVADVPVAEAPAEEKPCEECAKEAPAKPEKKCCAKAFCAPNLLVGLILSGLSFIAGIILFSICLAGKGSLGYGIDFLVILPALAGLVLGVYNLHASVKTENRKGKIVSFVSLAVAAFVILFAFIACCVLNANSIL